MSDWYEQWRHDALHELIEKNDRVMADFRINDWPRWDYGLKDCSLIFSDQGVPRVVAEVRLIGSTSKALNNWQWAWANSNWPPEVVSGVEAVKAYGEEHAIAELTHGWVEDDDDLNQKGWELSAVAARLLNGLGVYRPQTDNGALFFLYRSLRHLT